MPLMLQPMACLLMAYSNLALTQDHGLENRMPPLCAAAWRGDVDATQRLVGSGVSLEQVYQNQTPLMWAAKMGHLDVVSLLLHHGADVNRTIDGWTALRWATSAGEPGIVAELLSAGGDPRISDDDPFGTILHLAALQDDRNLIMMLAEAGAPLDKPSQDPGGTPLHVSALDGNGEAVRALLALGANPNAAGALGRSPLHVACAGGNLRVVEDLLQAGADPALRDELGMTPMHLAAMEGHERVIGEILRGRNSMRASELRHAQDDRGWGAAHYAAAFGHSRCLRSLIARNDPPDVQNNYGSTPLHWACTSGDIDSIIFLLHCGADLAAVDSAGRTPLQRWIGSLPAPFEGIVSAESDIVEYLPLAGIDSQSTDAPLLVVYQSPAYTIRPVSGLLLAIWRDGVVLSCTEPAVPGKDLRLGRIAPESARDLTALLAEVGFFHLPDTHKVAMHAGSIRIIAEHGGKRRKHEWDESVVSDFAPWYPNSVERTFTMIWILARRCIRSVQPSNSLPLDVFVHDRSFRGYNIDSPHSTPWIH